jgi:predicted NBD/HSP70 family sugar kinase
MIRIGVDLGGTKIEAIVLSPDGRELGRKRVATPQGDYPGTVEAVASLVESLESALAERSGSVGVGTPGVISADTGQIKNSNSTCLIGKPFDRDLAKRLGRPVKLANDANCFAVSEATDGAGLGAPVVFGVILGTGVGGGIVVRGLPLEGVNLIAGEWGHNPLPWPSRDEIPGPDCYCGKSGCIETWISGPGLSRDHETATGEALEAEEITARANKDTACEQTLGRYCERLARSLATVINVLDPDLIVLGGGMSNYLPLYDQVPRIWGRFVFSDRVKTRLVRAQHGDSSGVRGAAWL